MVFLIFQLQQQSLAFSAARDASGLPSANLRHLSGGAQTTCPLLCPSPETRLVEQFPMQYRTVEPMSLARQF